MRRVVAVAVLALVTGILSAVSVGVTPAVGADAPGTFVEIIVDPGVPGWDPGTTLYNEEDLSLLAVNNNYPDQVGVTVFPQGLGTWHFEFRSPKEGELVPGPFEDVRHESSSHALFPWIAADRDHDEICDGVGRFDLLQLEKSGYSVAAFAIDLEWHCGDWSGPAVTVRIRKDAAGDPYPPPQDSDGDGVPDTQDNCVDIANPDQSDADEDRLGDVCDPQFSVTWIEVYKEGELLWSDSPATSLVTSAGYTKSAEIIFEAESERSVYFSAPSGQSLVPGDYEEVRLGYSSESATIRVDLDEHCSWGSGSFTIHAHEWAPDGPTLFAADAVFSCEGDMYEVYVRYEVDPGPHDVAGTVMVESVPTSGITVEAFPDGSDTPAATTTTGTGGTYVMSLPHGRYDLRVSDDRITPQWRGGYALRDAANTLGVASPVTGVDFDAYTGGVIAGEIKLNGEGADPTEFMPWLYDPAGEMVSGWSNMRTFEVGNRHFYEVRDMPEGTYRLLIGVSSGRSGTPYGTGWFPDATSFDEARPILLSSGEVAKADVELWPAAILWINVVEPGGDEPRHLFIDVLASDGVTSWSTGDYVSYMHPRFIVGRGTWYVLGANFDEGEATLWDYFAEWYDDVPLLRPDLATPLHVEPNDELLITIELDPLFPDMFDSVFTGDIAWLRDTGITKGCEGGARFCTDDFVTRGEMAAFLVRALGLEDRGSVDYVDDDDSMFEADIEKLAAAGITRGCNPPLNTQFCPDARVTRQQMAAFLVRALGLTDRGTTDFVDDDWSLFETEIEILAAAGVTKGCNPPENDRFCPTSYVTRGQMAAFLHRALTLPSDAYGLEGTQGTGAFIDDSVVAASN